MKRVLFTLITSGLWLVGCTTYRPLTADQLMTAREAMEFVCEHTTDADMLEACQVLPPPEIKVDLTGAQRKDDGKLVGILGQFNPLADPGSIHLDVLMTQMPIWFQNAVIIHEVTHYLDWNDANQIEPTRAGACNTETKAHLEEHIYLVMTGHWEEFARDASWYEWYGC